MSEALGRLCPHESAGMLRGIRRATLRWSLEQAQAPSLAFPIPDP